MPMNIREKLHQQIDNLPDSIIEIIDTFTQALITKQETLEYCDWELTQWQEFFSEDDEIEYFLEDAREIYNFNISA